VELAAEVKLEHLYVNASIAAHLAISSLLDLKSYLGGSGQRGIGIGNGMAVFKVTGTLHTLLLSQYQLISYLY
jgi:hypothetical protein